MTTIVHGEASESDDEDYTLKTTPPKSDLDAQMRTLSGGNAESVVVAGEAEESDDDVDLNSPLCLELCPNDQKLSGSSGNVVVAGEADESDEDVEKSTPLALHPPLLVEDKGDRLGSQSSLLSSPMKTSKLKYSSLLHKKLRETNMATKEYLDGYLSKQYESSIKDLRSTAQQLAKSQHSIQEVSHSMRLITNELFQLEDKIDIVASCTILPNINIIPLSPSNQSLSKTLAL